MKMTYAETSFALLKSITETYVDTYEVHSTINFPGSQVSDFAGNLRARKLNKEQTKRMNIMGVQYFHAIFYSIRVHQQE